MQRAGNAGGRRRADPADVRRGGWSWPGSAPGLELLALERAAEHLAAVDGYVSMNVSPATLLTPECSRLLRGLPLPRILLELSEHDRVEDYDALRAVLQPLREHGMRLAIDDVGAASRRCGTSS